MIRLELTNQVMSCYVSIQKPRLQLQPPFSLFGLHEQKNSQTFTTWSKNLKYSVSVICTVQTSWFSDRLINGWSAILLCLQCIIFHEYMCGFLLFMEFWCFATRFSGCYEIWLSHFLINDWNSILLCLPCIIFHKYADFSCLQNFGVLLQNLAITWMCGFLLVCSKIKHYEI